MLIIISFPAYIYGYLSFQYPGMEAERGISDLTIKEPENQSPVSQETPTTPDLSLDMAIDEAWQDILQVQDSYKCYTESSSYSDLSAQGSKPESLVPQCSDTMSSASLSPDTPRQSNGSGSRFGRIYTRRNKQLNRNASVQKESLSDPQAQQSSDASEELSGMDQSGQADSMSRMLASDGGSRSGLLVDLNYPCDESMCMDSQQYRGGDCMTEEQHCDDFHGNSDPDSFRRTPKSSADGYKNMCAPMPYQSKLSPENTTSSNAQTEHRSYIEQRNQLTAARVDSEEPENKDDASPSSAAAGRISSFVENHNHDKRSSDRLNQDRTLQRKPRKKKHRPKVVSENKPKRAPKPHTSKPTNPTEEPRAKRKYERRKKPILPSTCLRERSSAVNSCRRSLNFNMVGQVEEGSFLHKSNCHSGLQADDTFSSESPPRHPVLSEKEETTMEEPNEATMNEELNEVAMTKEPNAGAYDLSCSENQLLKEYIQMPEEVPQTSCVAEVIASQATGKVLTRYQKRTMDGYIMEGSGRESSSTQTKFYGKRGQKRTFSSLIDEIRNLDATNAASCSPKNICFPNICKKRRTEKVQRRNRSWSSSSATTLRVVGPGSNPSASKYYHHQKLPDFTTQNNPAAQKQARNKNRVPVVHTWPDIQMLKKKRSKRPFRVRDLTSLTWLTGHTKTDAIHDNERQEYAEAEVVVAEDPQSCIEIFAAQSHEQEATTSCIETHHFSVSEAGREQDFVTNGSPTVNATGIDDWFISQLNQNQLSYLYMVPSPVPPSPGPSQNLPWCNEVDDISDNLQKLDLNKETSNITFPEINSSQNQNAIVRYQEDGILVPYEGPFDPVKKRPPRAKVDLDEETIRVWNLLLENIDNEGIDGTDAKKAKWWEDERRVFHGRVDSFIARMRLVQGDRRFSPWKGSVLDSVVGVFLTQNVSDHLSSSAFMSLAARFPSKLKSEVEMHFEGTSASTEDPTLHLEGQQFHDTSSGTYYIVDHGEEKEIVNSRELVERKLGQSSDDSCIPEIQDFCESSQNSHQELVTECDDCFVHMKKEANTSSETRAMDDITSSQESTLSSTVLDSSPKGSMAMRTRPGSQDYSDPTTSWNPSSITCSMPCLELLKLAETPMLQEDYASLSNQLLCSQGSTNDELQGRELKEQQMKALEKEIHGSPVRSPTISSDERLDMGVDIQLHEANNVQMVYDESRSENAKRNYENSASEQSHLTTELTTPSSSQEKASEKCQKQQSSAENVCTRYVLDEEKLNMRSIGTCETPTNPVHEEGGSVRKTADHQQERTFGESVSIRQTDDTHMEGLYDKPVPGHNTTNTAGGIPNAGDTNQTKGKPAKGEETPVDWDSLRKQAELNVKRERTAHTMDSVDYEAARSAGIEEIAHTIKDRGMNNRLALRIHEFFNRMVADHGSMDLEWLRDVPPDKAKEYLLSFKGLGLKSVECIRLLTLYNLAFPVDTNVARIAVRLGWVPLQPLPESVQLHLLELYPMMESIQQYLWPRLCKLDQKTLYELHYHMITFGKVFCTKKQPNCNACPLRAECRHFASAFASARLALPGPEERSIVASANCSTAHQDSQPQASEHPNSIPCDPACQDSLPMINPLLQGNQSSETKIIECEPIIEVPNSPERVPESPEPEQSEMLVPDIEDMYIDDPDEIPMIKLNLQDFTQTLQSYMQSTLEVKPGDISKALVPLTAEAASIPTRKLKNVSRLRTEHHVYELPDNHKVLYGLDRRETDDPSPYLLAIWTPGETANSFQPPEQRCSSQELGQLCDDEACSHCNSQREESCQIVHGTILIPCRTAMRGSFPLNGTYFQVNEVFADHDSSLKPIEVPRSWLWNLPRRTVYFGSSIPTIFRGMTTEAIQYCFWRGYVCVRGFERKTRAPRPLMARFHLPISKIVKAKGKPKDQTDTR